MCLNRASKADAKEIVVCSRCTVWYRCFTLVKMSQKLMTDSVRGPLNGFYKDTSKRFCVKACGLHEIN